MLSGGEIEGVADYIEIHSFLSASVTAFGAVGSNGSSFGIETLVKGETCTVNPSVMKLILNKYSKFDVAIVAEIDKGDLEEVPVVESEIVGVYFFIEVEPGEG